MTNHKFTDEQIIRCLNECYGKENAVAHIVDQGEDELVTLCRILEIINRQKAEIERLTVNMNAFGLGMKDEKERADNAIKEFAERLKAEMRNLARLQDGDATYYIVGEPVIDDLVKEMTEEHTHEMQSTDQP